MDLKPSPFLPKFTRQPLAIRVTTTEGDFVYDVKDPLTKHINRWKADWEYLYSASDLPPFKTTLDPELEKEARKYIKYLWDRNPRVTDDWESRVSVLLETLLRLHAEKV